jgi:adenylate cyclase
MDVLTHHQEGIRQYRAMDWNAAIHQFEQCLALAPNDALPNLYIGRCEFLRDNPPEVKDGQWDGVWVLDGK